MRSQCELGGVGWVVGVVMSAFVFFPLGVVVVVVEIVELCCLRGCGILSAFV